MISMWQVQLGNHPIALHLFPNGQVAFTPLKELNNTIIDYSDFMEVYITKFGIDLVDTETRDDRGGEVLAREHVQVENEVVEGHDPVAEVLADFVVADVEPDPPPPRGGLEHADPDLDAVRDFHQIELAERDEAAVLVDHHGDGGGFGDVGHVDSFSCLSSPSSSAFVRSLMKSTMPSAMWL